MRNPFESRLAQMRAEQLDPNSKPDFSSSPIRSLPPREQLSDAFLAFLSNVVFGSWRSVLTRLIIAGAGVIVLPALMLVFVSAKNDPLFETDPKAALMAPENRVLAEKSMLAESLAAQWELEKINLKIALGLMSDAERERLTANHRAELRRLITLAQPMK